MVHSGLQYGGLPSKPGIQEQDGTPPISRQSELGPHGELMHGFIGNSGFGSGAKMF